MGDLNNIKNRIKGLSLTLLCDECLNNIEYCIRNAVENNIDGDFIETGVWKGGAVIYAYHILKELHSNKKVYCADSFEGLPMPDVGKYPTDNGDSHWSLTYLKVDLETVKNNFKMFGEIGDNVIFLKGWFKDTLPNCNIEKLSVLRLDGDMYESTWEALEALYPKLSIGGFCIIDDFGLRRCHAAVLDYRNKFDITEEYISVMDNKEYILGTRKDVPPVYWVKRK